MRGKNSYNCALVRRYRSGVREVSFISLLNIVTMLFFGFVISGVYNICFISSSVSAYTASISTSGNVTVDVASFGDKASLGTDNIVVSSDCPSGYAVSIVGPTDNTLYKGGDNTSSDTIPASSGTVSNPVSILGNNLGTWGYSTANNTTVSSNFIGLTSTQTQIKTKASASSSGGDSFSVYYGVSVSGTTASGTYTLAESSQGAGDDTIVYYLTTGANCASYAIKYDDNGANSATTMSITHNIVENDEVTLAASNYQRQGYGFAGWSTIQLNPDSASFQTDLATAKAAGKVFGPNEVVTVDTNFLAQAVEQNGIYYVTMYAIWVKPAQNAYLQNWQGCDSMNTGDVIALTDQRDSQAYAVAKLADNNCWMIENMRLEATNSSDGTKAQGFGGAFSGLATAETSNFIASTTSNSKYSTSNITGSNQGYRFPRYHNRNTNAAVSNMSTTNANVYGYGNYYSFAAALANTTDFTTTTSSETASTSICPTGWRLPRGGDRDIIQNANTNDIYNLWLTLIGAPPAQYTTSTTPIWIDDNNTEGTDASKAIRTYPNNFIYSGILNNSSNEYRGVYGYYWTSTTKSGTNGFHYNFGDNGVAGGTWDGPKAEGLSVRCVNGNSSSYTVTINAGPGISTLTASGWTGSGTGTLTKAFSAGDTIDLSTIAPTRKTGYTGTSYSSAGSGSISGSTFTVGSGAGTITIGATGLITPTCTIQGGDTKVFNYASTILTATDNSSSYDTSSADIVYSFGYGSSATNTLGNFSATQAGNTYEITKNNTDNGSNGFYDTRYYGVRVTVTDKTDSSITSTCTSGTGTGTGSTVANRTTVARFNSRINFDANGGTLSGTSPVYVAYENSTTYSSRTATTVGTIPSATPPTGQVFDGWWTASSGGNQVIDGSGNIQNSVADWTDANGRWIRTTFNSSAVTTDTLFAHYTSGTTRKTLYEEVEDQSRGTQTAANLQASLNASNSGVYEYNSTAFGADTDGAKGDNTKATIYYYRGILDNTTGTYGSNGDGAAYPNYVILDADGTKTTADTCWRIIRTTGSGGTKMIYNGNWTGSTCANATTSAQISSPVATSTFNGTANTTSVARQAVRVGYTHNSTYATTSNSTQTPDTLFGSNSNYSVNNTNSTIKGNVESWYNSNLTSYTSILEPNAGYCNDRSAFQNTSGSTATSTLRSYTTNTNQTGATYRAYFGAYTRNIGTSKVPGLGCSKSTVDVYSTSTSAGGNGQLAAPVALITADEASFAGSGSQTANQGSGYNANSFLRTGSTFWTMSPYYRYGSYAYNFYMNTNGYMQNGRVDAAYGIRPVVSLQDGTTPSDGTGTATDPWVIMAP